MGLLDAHVPTAPCVSAIRAAVKQWKDNNYKGVTPTTRSLLNHWFLTDHRFAIPPAKSTGGGESGYHEEREPLRAPRWLAPSTSDESD
jgi:hypothetical protein